MVAMESRICDFGWQAADFDLEGVGGKRYTLADVRGENGTLVMFICNHCPYVKSILDRIVRDVTELKSHGIGSIAIMPNEPAAYPEDSFDDMVRVAREKGFTFPYVIDHTQETARAYETVCTPDFYGFDAQLGLQYRGRLDASRLEPVSDAPRELFNAMVQVAKTGRGPADQIASIGCSIKWKNE